MIVPVLAFAAGVVAVEFYGWLALGVTVLAGSKIICWTTERTWGKFPDDDSLAVVRARSEFLTILVEPMMNSQASSNGEGQRARPESAWKLACRYAVSDGVPRRSLYVALVVGTVLTLINQGDALLGAASFSWLKAILTYAVPYAVCSYGAVAQQLNAARRRPVNKPEHTNH